MKIMTLQSRKWLRLRLAVGLVWGISCWVNPAQAEPVDNALNFLRGQITGTGFVDSYPDDGTDRSYTYDNAMAALAFISAGDFPSARRILDAFNAIAPPYVHRYRTQDGRPDGIVNTGHHGYILQAMNLYYVGTGDSRYNLTAQRVGNFLVSVQDSDGGLFGRPGAPWKSTENNLGAFAALYNLGRIQNIPYFLEKAELIRNFLTTECWDGERFFQGENDRNIVTDVQALGTLALGPDYAGAPYWIEWQTLNTQRYSGRKRVTGFALEAQPPPAVIWTEGTLQMTLAFDVNFDLSRAKAYRAEAEKLIYPSGALAQASNPGTVGGDPVSRTPAVSPTAWYVLAANKDNVFELL